jgi:replicative DNA helicase
MAIEHTSTPSTAVPPHDIDAESSVLGAILLSDRVLDPLLIDVALKADDFYRERHRLIYRSMIRLKDASESIDALTLTADLRETGDLEEAGGSDYVHSLVGQVPSLANARQYGQIVKENALLRNLLRASAEIQASVTQREGDPRELLERAQQRVFEVAHDTQSAAFKEIGDVLHDELEKLEQLALHGSALTGTTSGFRDIDELTGGFQPGNLVIIAARPSMGKSALVTNIAENAALAGSPVALFSLEMSQTELAQRFIASQAKIDNDALRKGKVRKDRWPAVIKAAQALSEAPLWIDDSSDINILELRAKARRLDGKSRALHNKGLGLVIVDYLQLLRANDPRENRVEQVSQMSRGLKILARELDVPVIAVSQLSRQVESRHPPRPVLSDLRESGQIEQDADLVMFLYRDEYYLRDESQRPGEADVIVSKHRNGPIGEIALTFMSRFPKFASMPRGHVSSADVPGEKVGTAPGGEPDLDEF